jgi:ATP-dependent Zn protease
VSRLLREADQRAFELLESRRTDLDAVVNALTEREEVYYEDIVQLIGPSKSQPHPDVDGQKREVAVSNSAVSNGA